VCELEADLKEESARPKAKEAGIHWCEIQFLDMAGQSMSPRDIAAPWDQLRWQTKELGKIQENHISEATRFAAF
jgi:hypothetical protein